MQMIQATDINSENLIPFYYVQENDPYLSSWTVSNMHDARKLAVLMETKTPG